jgi:hypothetical protein
MAVENIFQHPIVTRFVLPFLLIWFMMYAILLKTKILGENNQINAVVSLVIGAIFIGSLYPTQIANSMVLFLSVAVVVLFVGLMLWGFVSGGKAEVSNGPLKWVFGILIFIAILIAVLYSMGIEGGVMNFLFFQSWSETFWTNVVFIGVIIGALVLMIKTGSSS